MAPPEPPPSEIRTGAFAGLMITANMLMSLAIEHFGLLHMQQHAITPLRAIGAVLTVAGIAPIARFLGKRV
jgi:transporter family-2 protein